jgi:uncharacterized protein (TIGR00288 family)
VTVQRLRVGVFIDGENVAASHISKIFEVAERHGTALERRVYGNLAAAHLKPWIDIAPHHALSLQTTVQAVPGKNCADIALAVDVVELLLRGHIDVLCLATSDSDFTHLAMWIRQQGKKAIGVGSPKAAVALQVAFNEFQFFDEVPPKVVAAQLVVAVPPKNEAPAPGIFPLLKKVMVAEEIAAGEWMDLGLLSHAIRKVAPDFRNTDYGNAKLSSVLKNCPALEVRLKEGQSMQVRIRPIRTVSANAQA